VSEQARRRARELARRLQAAEARREAQAAGFDLLVSGWLSTGGVIPWERVPMAPAAREASRRGH
jgi:hypothetical protein